MSRIKLNERGFGLLEAFIGTLIVMAGAGALGTVIVNMSDTSRAAEKQAKPVAPIPFIGPALPNAADTRDCYLAVAARHRLTQASNGGWREEADHPMPTLTGDVAKDKGALEVWRYGLQGYIDDFKFEFETCDKVRREDTGGGVRPPEPTTSTTDKFGLTFDPNATYVVTVESASQNCLRPYPSQLGAQVVGEELNIIVPFKAETLRARGTMSSQGYFNASGSNTIGRGSGLESEVALRVQGRFALVEGRIGIAPGAELEVSSDGVSCTLSFFGRT
ncbi:MAG: hypothetical protein Q8K63_04375 [Acidimicrobiales bacterium]|nr:hypothetical protein [Acidimicrobiales bacterium]